MAGTARKPSKAQTRKQRQELDFVDIVNSNQPKDLKSLEQMRIEYKCKTENQKNLVNSIKDNMITVCSGYPGSGKAQPLDSLVLTQYGFVEMGSLKVGDKVTTPFNELSEILEIHPQGVIPIYNVTFSDGSVTQCCIDHLWETNTIDEREFKKDKSIKGFYGSVKSTQEISKNIKIGNKFNHQIRLTESIESQPVDLGYDPLYLGINIVQFIDSPVYIRHVEKCISGSINQRIDFLNGLTLANNKYDALLDTNVIEIGDRLLSQLVRLMVQSLGGVCIIGVSIDANGDFKYKLEIHLPKQIFKKTVLAELNEWVKPKRFIVSIEFAGEKEAQCISIKHEKHLYITDGFIVTHNTYLTCAVALELFKTKQYDRIIIAKSVQTIKDEEIGFLKGTLKEKMEPTIQSFIQNFNKLIGKGYTKMLMDNELIEVMPLAYIRGCNRDNEIVIVDECQNISVDNIRTVLTRIGENTKMILLGDEEQIDMKDKGKSSLKYIKEKLNSIPDIGVVELGHDDVIRNPIIKLIEAVFRADSSK